MEEEYRVILKAVAEAASQAGLKPEELAVYICEGTYSNCPTIYEALKPRPLSP
jgi:hypothetical protein